MKRILILTTSALLIAIFAAVSAVAQGTVSLNSDTQWHGNSVDNAYMSRRISDAAEQYKEYAPIPRIAFYDIGYPKDKAEMLEMNGYAVLLVSSLAQDPQELPPNRVYVTTPKGETELKRFREVRVRNQALESQTVKTFGQYRVDTLYLLPLYIRFAPGELLIDFAKNRVGLKLAEFDGSIPNELKHLSASKPVEKKPFDAALKLFMNREYPGYFDK